MKREFNVIIERDSEGYFVAEVVGLPGCHTQGRSIDELLERVKEAIEVSLEAQKEPATRLDFVGLQKVIVGT